MCFVMVAKASPQQAPPSGVESLLFSCTHLFPIKFQLKDQWCHPDQLLTTVVIAPYYYHCYLHTLSVAWVSFAYLLQSLVPGHLSSWRAFTFPFSMASSTWIIHHLVTTLLLVCLLGFRLMVTSGHQLLLCVPLSQKPPPGLEIVQLTTITLDYGQSGKDFYALLSSPVTPVSWTSPLRVPQTHTL